MGKPYIKGHSNIFYNMSHSGKYSVCAFSKKEIGVDIQQIKPCNLNIAKKYFHQQEYAPLSSLSKDEQIDAFFNSWVLYESFLKAIGTGLCIDFSKFYFKRYPNSIYVVQDYNKLDYQASLCDIDDQEYKLAVCVNI